MRLLVLLLLAVAAFGQTEPAQDPASSRTLDRWLLASKIAYGASMAADAASSWQREELNPILQSTDKRFNGKGLAIKSAITGGVLTGEWAVLKKWPSLKKPVTVGNFCLSGIMIGVAIRNYRQVHP